MTNTQMNRGSATALGDLEVRILETGIELRDRGEPEFHAYALAKAMQGTHGSSLAAHGTLYRALSKMESKGLVKAWWEDPSTAESERRPRRRFYQITGVGVQALQEWARSHTTAFRLVTAQAGS
jgi:DNA-binding PadR family transcriptional regulator